MLIVHPLLLCGELDARDRDDDREQDPRGGGGESEIAANLIVVAIGQSRLAALVARFPGVELDRLSRIVVDPASGRTGHPRVYAGGDCVNGGKEVVNAVAEGQGAARAILAELDKSRT